MAAPPLATGHALCRAECWLAQREAPDGTPPFYQSLPGSIADVRTRAARLFFDPARHAEMALRAEKRVLGLAEKAAHERFRAWREAGMWIVENAGARASSRKPSTSHPPWPGYHRTGTSGTMRLAAGSSAWASVFSPGAKRELAP